MTKNEENVTSISVGNNVVTLVNVFTTEPSKADELLKLLSDATEQVIKNLPGFVSANLHKSLDGTRVTNYAQWRSKEDMEAMLRNPEAMKHLDEVPKYGSADPHLYKVVSVHH